MGSTAEEMKKNGSAVDDFERSGKFVRSDFGLETLFFVQKMMFYTWGGQV